MKILSWIICTSLSVVVIQVYVSNFVFELAVSTHSLAMSKQNPINTEDKPPPYTPSPNLTYGFNPNNPNYGKSQARL